MRGTSINHDGKNNYQSDFAGDQEQVIQSWKNEVTRRNVAWSRLFDQATGKHVASYINGSFELLDEWKIEEAPDGKIVVQHSDGSGVVVSENDRSSIAAAILHRLARGILKTYS